MQPDHPTPARPVLTDLDIPDTDGDLSALSALTAWQRRMERYPQLDAETQAELVIEYQRGLAAKQRIETTRLDLREERKLRALVKAGELAGERLAGANFRLLLLIARDKAQSRFGKGRMLELLPDLIAEANIALLEAARAYKPGQAPTFPTYLAKVVRDRIMMVLARQAPIKVPPSWVRAKRIYSVLYPKLVDTLGREPTLDEIKADMMETCLAWAEDHLTEAERQLSIAEQEQAKLNRLRKQGMLGAIARIDEVLQATQTTASVDAPLSDDGGSIADVLAAPADESMTRRVELEELGETIHRVLQTFPERERDIILHRYGFVDGTTWTYAKISKLYNVTPERIRQIEHAVLEQMRLPHAHYAELAAHLDVVPD